MFADQYNYYGNQSPMNFNQQPYYMGGYPVNGYPSYMQQQYPIQGYNPNYGYQNQQNYQQPQFVQGSYQPFQNNAYYYNNPSGISMMDQFEAEDYNASYLRSANAYNTSDPTKDNFVYVPGRISKPQFEDSNGNSVDADTFIQGGKSVIEGGYNPVTGQVTPRAEVQGNFEPHNNGMAQHAQYGNPNYNNYGIQQQYYNGYGQNPYLNYQQQMPYGGYGYNNPGFAPQQSMYAYANGRLLNNPMLKPINGIPVNDFNSYFYSLLYNEDDYAVDIKSELNNIILTDEEKEKANKNRFANSGMIIGYDYFNQPVYSNSFGTNMNTQMTFQQQYEQARESYIDFYMHLSDVLHAYEGDSDKVDKEKLRKRFDPNQYMTNNQNQNNNGFGKSASQIYAMSDNDRKEYMRDLRVQQTWQMEADFERATYNNECKRQFMQNAFAQIKASHDKMLGIEPGQHYDLATYLDNGYKLAIAGFKEKGKKATRNGKQYFSTNNYRNQLARKVNHPIHVDTNDDEYVPIEVKLKDYYAENKNFNNLLITSDGMYTLETKKKSELTDEDIRRIKFLNEAQAMKARDDQRRSQEGWG